MKKFAILAGLAVVAAVVALQSGSGNLAGYAKTLSDAQGMSATFTYQKIGGSPSSYKIDLARPGMARIDKGDELIVADGKTITVYDKKAKTYFKTAQTDAELNKYFTEDEFSLFAPFFNAAAFDKLPKVADAGTKNRKGMTLSVVETQLDQRGLKKATFYIDPATKLARQVEYAYSDTGEVVRMLVDTKEFTLVSEPKMDLFAFSPPEGSRELTLEEMNSDKWYYNLEEAKEVAKKTKRLLFVDFYADW